MRRRSLITAAVGLAVVVAAYTLYWFVLARTVDRDIEGWTAYYRSQGYAMSYSRPPLEGFPFAVTARFLYPDVVAPNGLWRWRGGVLRLKIRPWAPYELQFTAPGSHRLSIAGAVPREMRLKASNFALTLHLKDGVQPDRFGLTLDDAAIADAEAGGTQIQGLAADGRFPSSSPGETSRSSLDLIAHLSRLTLPENVAAPLGREIYSIHLVAQVMGALPDSPPRQALESWSAAGGDVELRDIELAWGGLWLRGDATLALDRALQPQMAGSFAVANLGKVLDRLSAAGVLSSGAAATAKIMFAALAVAPPDGGLPQVKLPLTIQDGALFMGPIQLAELRPVDWSWLP